MNVQECVNNKSLRTKARAYTNKNLVKSSTRLFSNSKNLENLKLYSFDRSGLNKQIKSKPPSQLSTIISI